MRREITVTHEGAKVIVTVDDPMDGREWEEREIYIEGDAMQLIEALTMPRDCQSAYYGLMDKVGAEILKQRREGKR